MIGSGAFEAARRRVVPVDPAVAAAARGRHDGLAKPAGSLGRLEALGIRLAVMAGQPVPPRPAPVAAVLFAADHGVVATGVTPWPSSVTASMVRLIAAGGAASSVLARQCGAELVVVDVGVAEPLPDPLPGDHRVVRRKVAPGTADLSAGPALRPDEVRAALDVGADLAAEHVARGARCLVTGEMGIGNTTASAAVIAALTGRLAAEVTGRGTGIDDETLVRKQEVVARAVSRLDGAEPHRVLAEVGGLEIAALAGLLVGGAAERVPVILDGVITLAAALAAARLAPAAVDYWVAGHRPTEPGGRVVLDALGLDPVLDLGLRLGEGTGALLAVPVVQAAAAVLAEMASLEEALAPGTSSSPDG